MASPHQNQLSNWERIHILEPRHMRREEEKNLIGRVLIFEEKKYRKKIARGKDRGIFRFLLFFLLHHNTIKGGVFKIRHEQLWLVFYLKTNYLVNHA